jgi:hypothetical protein
LSAIVESLKCCESSDFLIKLIRQGSGRILP